MSVERLRFKDENGNFYDGHKTEYLKNVAHIKKGKQLSVKNMIEHGEYYVLNGGIEPSGFTNEWNTESNTISISEGGNSCGYVNLNKEKFWSGGHNYTLQELQLSLNYLYSFLKYKQLRIMSLRVGSGLPNIQKRALEKLKIKIPDPKEQEKIGNFLSLFDRLIEKIETKIELLKELKKGYLQQMFPAKGEKVPKIRFEGFDEDWELKQYNDVLIERREIAPESEKYPLMSFIAEHGVVKKSDRYNREFLVKDEYKKYKRTLFGDFIYSSNNLTTGSIGLNKFGDASISPVYSIFLTKKNYYFHFISEYLTLNYNIFKMLRYRQGVVYGQYRIPESDFLKIKSRFPNFSEQEKIGNFFKGLDLITETHDREMNTIEQLIKGYMQRLFA